MVEATKGIDTVLITPIAQTNTATGSARLDTIGSDWCTIRIPLSAELNTNAVGPTISLLECDTTVVTSFATITADRTEDLTTAHELRYEVDLRARKRYLRLTLSTATATNDDVTYAAIATLSRNSQNPSGTAAMQSSTNDAVVLV